MKNTLLIIDGIVNLFLGALLLLFPAGMLQFLGLPPVRNHFYTTILGGETTIGARSIIGGNIWLTESVSTGTKVLLKKPELIYHNTDLT